MKHRIFVALPVSAEMKKAVSLWQKEHADLPARWISPKNLHITLIPPWYTVDISHVHTQLLTNLCHGGNLSKICSCTVRFQKITAGTNARRKRLIWVEGKRNNHLIVLKHQLETILGQKPEKRGFLPHITIGRLKKGEKFPFKEISEKVSWKMDVRSFCLMESHLKHTGAEYQILRSYNLL